MTTTVANNTTLRKMTVEEFLSWTEEQPGRYELVDGVAMAMSPERSGHARTKHRVAKALENAITDAELDCEMMPDGMTVRVNDFLAYEPDALVYCGRKIDDDAVIVPNPVIVVEVLSPGTKAVDFGGKLEGYFKIESVEHYLIVNVTSQSVIHHRRGAAGLIETRVVGEGDELKLEPPGVALGIVDLFD